MSDYWSLPSLANPLPLCTADLASLRRPARGGLTVCHFFDRAFLCKRTDDGRKMPILQAFSCFVVAFSAMKVSMLL